MKIVADENIPYVKEAFGTLGDVVVVPGRAIGPDQVRDAEVLLVRSVTPVNDALLGGSRVRFVGSATIGLDHVDESYLRAQGIVLAYAPGSNANSVAEYVMAALVALGRERYEGRTLGIVGLGRIGTLVHGKAPALGMTVLANDPPLERAGHAGLTTLEDVLKRSDIVTCHVPLTREGPDATYHLFDDARCAWLQRHAVVLNTSRGAVIDNAVLLLALQEKRLGGAVLDVWEGEPEPDPRLIHAVTIGTPHVAGYSWDGKVAGTATLYAAACAWLKRAPEWAPPEPRAENRRWPVVLPAEWTRETGLRTLVLGAYDIRHDDAALRDVGRLPDGERGRGFDRLRAAYPVRLEFRHTTVVIPAGQARQGDMLQRLGFTVL